MAIGTYIQHGFGLEVIKGATPNGAKALKVHSGTPQAMAYSWPILHFQKRCSANLLKSKMIMIIIYINIEGISSSKDELLASVCCKQNKMYFVSKILTEELILVEQTF